MRQSALPILTSGWKETSSMDIKVNTMSVLGNIVGAGIQCRDAVLHTGVLDLLLNSLRTISHQMSPLAENEQQIDFARWSTWFLCNIYRREHPDSKYDSNFVACLRILFNCKDQDAMMNLVVACKSFMNGFSTNTGRKITALIEIGVVEFFVKILQFEEIDLAAQSTIVRCLCRTSNTADWQRILDSGVFSIIATFLQSERNQHHAFILIKHFSKYRAWTNALVEQNCIGSILQKLYHKEDLYNSTAFLALSRAIKFHSVGDEYDSIYIAAVTKFIPESVETMYLCGIILGLQTILVILNRAAIHWTNLKKNGFIEFIKDFQQYMKKARGVSRSSTIVSAIDSILNVSQNRK